MTQKIQQFPLLLLMTNMFIVMTGIGLVIPIMPTIMHEFNAGGQTLGLLIATFSLAQFLFSPFAGDLSDRVWSKKNYYIGFNSFFIFAIYFCFFTAAFSYFLFHVQSLALVLPF